MVPYVVQVCLGTSALQVSVRCYGTLRMSARDKWANTLIKLVTGTASFLSTCQYYVLMVQKCDRGTISIKKLPKKLLCKNQKGKIFILKSQSNKNKITHCPPFPPPPHLHRLPPVLAIEPLEDGGAEVDVLLDGPPAEEEEGVVGRGHGVVGHPPAVLQRVVEAARAQVDGEGARGHGQVGGAQGEHGGEVDGLGGGGQAEAGRADRERAEAEHLAWKGSVSTWEINRIST